MTERIHDLLIVGGGLVGASLACALDGSGLDVALAESEPATAPMIADADARSLALAAASLNALAALGVLRQLPTPPAPIRRIHVSRSGDFGSVRLDAGEYGRDAFGGVVAATALGAALQARLRQVRGLRHLSGARLVAMREGEGWREADVAGEQGTTTLKARLVVGADGTFSFVRAALGIATTAHDYQQHLFASSVRAARVADGQAWERFTDDGPVALLPRLGGDYGCICTVRADEAEAVAALADDDFRALLQARLGWRAGRLLAVGRRSGHPLRQRLAQDLIATRAVLMGNAAQTLHPVGAQGFNLGLRDALTLAELVGDAREDVGSAAMLAEYARRRADDRAQTVRFSDGLARLTALPMAPARGLRSLAMRALADVPALRARLASGAMGFRGRVPALAGDGVPGADWAR